jgi:ABC-2 type transport system permease protein
MKLNKYLSIFKISFQQEFVYRLNFVMWRLRNVMQIFLIFFLWSAVFSDPTRIVFGYDQGKILTYVLGILILRAIVFSARAVDIPGEISTGDLSNYLLKPVGYLRYWFTRDLSSKTLNLSFAFLETIILFLILRPPFFLQTNPSTLFLFTISVLLAVLLYFSLIVLVSMTPFWAPSSGWGAQFLFVGIVTEFLSGAVFPLDVMPSLFQKTFHFLPFQYLLFFPLQVYLGKINLDMVLSGIIVEFVWVAIFVYLVNVVWKRGIKRYAAEGR